MAGSGEQFTNWVAAGFMFLGLLFVLGLLGLAIFVAFFRRP